MFMQHPYGMMPMYGTDPVAQIEMITEYLESQKKKLKEDEEKKRRGKPPTFSFGQVFFMLVALGLPIAMLELMALSWMKTYLLANFN